MKAQYEQGKITYQQFNDELALIKTVAPKMVQRMKSGKQVGMLTGFTDLRATPAITQQQWNSRNTAKSAMAFRRMGIVRNGNTKINDSVRIFIYSK